MQSAATLFWSAENATEKRLECNIKSTVNDNLVDKNAIKNLLQ